MKRDRQRTILRLITDYEIETQEELATKLTEEGFDTTKATVSRDIRELRLRKITSESGRQKYAPGESSLSTSAASYRQILRTGISSVEAAENIVVIKTVSGVAMAVAAALDHMHIDGIAGCIAGDDTIFIAVRKKILVDSVVDAIHMTLN